ncbi:hypothetical protein D3C73_1265630 [compost metagenome]
MVLSATGVPFTDQVVLLSLTAAVFTAAALALLLVAAILPAPPATRIAEAKAALNHLLFLN